MQLFVRDLTVIDASLLCPEQGVVGDSWIVDVVLEGALDEQSMVLDFGEVKRRIKRAIDDLVDHKLLVPGAAQGIHLTRDDAHRIWLDFVCQLGSYHFYTPEQAIAIIDAPAINSDSLQQFLQQQLLELLPDNVGKLTLTLRNEVITDSYYQYSHGLKKHAGNCQRIAHGHRSTLAIYLDGKRRADCEHYWADRWRNIYLGSQDDITEVLRLNLSEQGQSLITREHVAFSYQASQGWFEMALPAHCCEILPMDTTVECLAEYLAYQTAEMLKSVNSNEQGRLKVVAYEGIGKGAICEIEL